MPEHKILTDIERLALKAQLRGINRELKRLRQMSPAQRKKLVNCCGNLFIAEKQNLVRLTVKCGVCGNKHEYIVEPQEVDAFNQHLVGEMCVVCYGAPVENLQNKADSISQQIAESKRNAIYGKNVKITKFSDYINVPKEDKREQKTV